jgi:D-serine/D-alanine/glycine transporter
VFLLSSVVLLYAGQSIIEAFTIVTTISALLFMFIWSIILASYVQYRRKRPDLHEKSTFKMPGGHAAIAMVFAFFAFILWALAQKPDTAVALKVTPIWFALLGIAYLVIKAKRMDAPPAIRS